METPVKRSTVLPISALLLAACSDSPVAPPRAPASAPAVSASLSVAEASPNALDFSTDLSAITTSVLPGFADAQAAERLRLDLAALSAALTAGDKTEAARLLAVARADLTPEASNGGDVGYVEMVFRNIAEALQ